LNVEEDIAQIKKQVLAALILSKEHVRNSVVASQGDLKHDFIWKAYSQVELAIGLAKLSYKDQIKESVGRFRDLKGPKKLKSEEKSYKLNLKLQACEILLEQSIFTFQKEQAEEGLNKAREARDILKLLILDENLTRTKMLNKRI
jgi:hypothetical protein